MDTKVTRQTEVKKYVPFVKWVGGKRGLVDQILRYIPKDFKNYYEPFVGGGAVFFELFAKGMLNGKKVVLFDINSELVNAYRTIKNDPERLIACLKRYQIKHSKDFYYQIRNLDRNKEEFERLDTVERAARFIYLNKTCFNGLYRVNKKGQFNTPMGRYKNPKIADEHTIFCASEALQDVEIVNKSYEEVVHYADEDDLVYFDPPYYPLTSTSNFTAYDSNLFLDEEQKALYRVFDRLASKGVHVLQSNSDTVFIKNLYANYDIQIVYANRFINAKSAGRGKISEVLIRSVKD